MAKVTIYITLKPTLLDAQGRTVENALRSLGHDQVSGVRIGKVIEMTVAGNDADSIRGQVVAMCEKLLANPVTEDFRIEVQP